MLFVLEYGFQSSRLSTRINTLFISSFKKVPESSELNDMRHRRPDNYFMWQGSDKQKPLDIVFYIN